MINAHDKFEIVRRLQQTADGILTREELEQMLNEELDRPAQEMDTELVQAILEALEAEEIPAGAQQEAWANLSSAAKGKRPAVLGWTLRIAAVLAAVAGLFFVTWQTAEAFNIRFLQRIFEPLTEHFTIQTSPHTVDAPPTAPATQEVGYGTDGKPVDNAVYAALTDCPETLMGYPIRPAGVPERFTYLQGSLYSDDLNTVVSHLFIGEEGLCIFSATILENGAASSAHYDKTESGVERYIGNIPVAFYMNSDDGVPSVSWVLDQVQYSVVGPLTEAELALIVEATMLK